jgi:hypothetical protein
LVNLALARHRNGALVLFFVLIPGIKALLWICAR